MRIHQINKENSSIIKLVQRLIVVLEQHCADLASFLLQFGSSILIHCRITTLVKSPMLSAPE